MKNILFSILLIATAGHAQQISGTLKNFPSGQFLVKYSPEGITSKTDTVYVDESGKFTYTWKMKYPALITLAYSDFISANGFMGPNLNLVIGADMTSPDTYESSLNLNGTAANYNKLFIKKARSTRHRSYDIWRHYDSLMKMTESDLIHFINSFQWIDDSLRKDHFSAMKKDRLAKYFQRADSIDQQYYALYWIIMYGNELKGFQERNNFFNKYAAPFIRALDDPAAVTLLSYHYTMSWWLDFEYQKAVETGDTAWFASRYRIGKSFYIADQLYPNPGFLQSYYGNMVIPTVLNTYLNIAPSMFPQFDTVFENVIIRIKDEKVSQRFRSQHTEMRAKALFSKKGQPAPDFNMVDSSGKSHRLSEFKGKAVVIDVWAAYCKPCIAEFPHMRKLQQKFEARTDLIFMNLAIDANKRDWIEKGLRKHLPVGLSFWAGDVSTFDFQKSYYISHIPHVIVIDKNGAFVKYSAPAPSEGDGLEKLIIQAVNAATTNGVKEQ